MLDYYDALRQLLSSLPAPADAEFAPLAQAAGRVLAADLVAVYDTPAFDNSAMDGYAVCDPTGAMTQFQVVGRIPAGALADRPLQAGEAVRIFTGAPVPAGATAVVAQEDANCEAAALQLAAPARPAQHIRRRAEEYARGAPLLAAGQRLGPAAIALAASQGYATLPVYPRLRVTVFSSGNELQAPGAPLEAGRIFDANRYQLLAWLAESALDVVDGGILPDDAGISRERLAAAAADSDVILTSGGVSVGEEDHVKAALEAIGTLLAWKIAIKPGKPFAWGRAGRAQLFMLPGNPVATFVTYHQLVAPALRQMAGQHAPAPRALPVCAAFAKPRAEARREFQRARLRVDGARLLAELLPGQGSAMLSACAAADALVEIPPGTTVAPGDVLLAYPLVNGK